MQKKNAITLEDIAATGYTCATWIDVYADALEAVPLWPRRPQKHWTIRQKAAGLLSLDLWWVVHEMDAVVYDGRDATTDELDKWRRALQLVVTRLYLLEDAEYACDAEGSGDGPETIRGSAADLLAWLGETVDNEMQHPLKIMHEARTPKAA